MQSQLQPLHETQVTGNLIDKIGTQKFVANLVAATNYTSSYVRECMNKMKFPHVAEGLPNNRFHEGGDLLDDLEKFAISEACSVFGGSNAIVQSWRCTNAIMAVCLSLAKPGQTILGLSCSSGGYYMTGSSKAHYLSNIFKIATYDVRSDNYLLDYDHIEACVKKEKPAIIFAGDTSYSRIWDWSAVASIAARHGALMVADISQTAGLIAAGLYPSPIQYADAVVFASYKTLGGPHGAVITAKDPTIVNEIFKGLYPKTQGSACAMTIAGIAAALEYTTNPQFKQYSKRIISSSQALSKVLIEKGLHVLTDGTDNHSFVVALPEDHSIDANIVCQRLRKKGILTNKTPIPFDKRPINQCSGIRIGTVWLAQSPDSNQQIEYLSGVIANTVSNN